MCWNTCKTQSLGCSRIYVVFGEGNSSMHHHLIFDALSSKPHSAVLQEVLSVARKTSEPLETILSRNVTLFSTTQKLADFSQEQS